MSDANSTTNPAYVEIIVLFMDDDEITIFCDMDHEHHVEAYVAANPTGAFFYVTDSDGKYHVIPSSWIKMITSEAVHE